MADTLDYRALFRQLPENYLLLAPDGTILDNTDAHVQVSLLPREQAVGRHIFDAFPGDPQSQADLDASHEVVRRTGQPHAMPLLRYDIERPAALGGGTEERYWQITHYPRLDGRGELQFILQQSQDVTEATLAARRSAATQRALDEATERTRFILESLPVMVWTTRPDGHATSFNARWVNYTGRPLADTLGVGWAADLHPDDLERTVLLWDAARAQNQPYQAEYRMRRHDGSYRWHLAQGVPRLGPEGEVLMWVGCNVDIDDQRKMVDELQQSIEQQAVLSDQAYGNLQLAQQQRQTLFDLFMSAPAMISIVRGPDHRYEFANAQFLQLVGHQQVVGSTVAEVFPEIVSQGIVEMLDRVYQSGEPAVGQELPIVLNNAQGQAREAYFNFTYQRFEENGRPAGITAYAYEVTELVRARQALAAR